MKSRKKKDKIIGKLSSVTPSTTTNTPCKNIQADMPSAKESSISKDGAGMWMGIPAAIFFMLLYTKPDNIVGLNGFGILVLLALAGSFFIGFVKWVFGK